MFSNATMAASRTMPVANARPASETTLSVRPARLRSTTTAIRQIGIADEMISVPRHSRMKNHSTPTASRMPMTRSEVTIPIAWLMKWEGSKDQASLTPCSFAGPALIFSISAFTALTVASTFAPSARNTCRPSAGLPF